MGDSNFDRAYELFKRAAAELSAAEGFSREEIAQRLRDVSNKVLDALDQGPPDEGDPQSRLDREAQEISSELKRIERLMRDRIGTDS